MKAKGCIAPLVSRDGLCLATLDPASSVPLCHKHFQQTYEDRKKQMDLLRAESREREQQRQLKRFLERGGHTELVYFATSGEYPGYVKIGTTTNIRERLKSLRLTPVLTIHGGVRVERRFHARWANLRDRVHDREGGTEWFRLHDDLEMFIRLVVARRELNGRAAVEFFFDRDAELANARRRWQASDAAAKSKRDQSAETLRSISADYQRALQKLRTSA